MSVDGCSSGDARPPTRLIRRPDRLRPCRVALRPHEPALVRRSAVADRPGGPPKPQAEAGVLRLPEKPRRVKGGGAPPPPGKRALRGRQREIASLGAPGVGDGYTTPRPLPG